MESSAIIAIITAITSIVVALIQMTTSLRVASLKELPAQPRPVSVESKVPVKTSDSYRTWFWIGSILIIGNIIWQMYLGSPNSGYIQFGSVLWCTCLLAYFRPIRWAYIAGVVALINGVSIMISFVQIGAWISDDLNRASVFYIGNAILATGIAYMRMRNSESK